MVSLMNLLVAPRKKRLPRLDFGRGPRMLVMADSKGRVNEKGLSKFVRRRNLTLLLARLAQFRSIAATSAARGQY